MIINDYEMQTRAASQRLHDAEKQKAKDYCQQVFDNRVDMNDPEKNPTLFARQLGQRMLNTVFEAKLSKLNPNLTYRDHPSDPSKRVLYHNRLGKLFVYENGLMPEFSWRTGKKTIVEKPQDKGYVIQRGDLPKGEWIPHQFNPDGSVTIGRWEFEKGALMPGQEEVVEGWHEKLRGWRTVLSKLVFEGHISAAQADRAFGPCPRKSWAVNIGKV